MKDKITPTPWRYEWDDNGFFVIDGDGRPSPYIAATGTGCDPGSICEANAQAIVTAVNCTYGANIDPTAVKDLYDCLEEAIAQIKYLSTKFTPTGSGNAVTSRCEAAIQKAKL